MFVQYSTYSLLPISLSTSSSRLTAAVAGVGEEGADLVGRRRQAGQVEVDAAEELGVGAEARGRIFIRFHLAATSSSIRL